MFSIKVKVKKNSTINNITFIAFIVHVVVLVVVNDEGDDGLHQKTLLMIDEFVADELCRRRYLVLQYLVAFPSI